jgi:DNA-binding MarR family transcriptional regulator
MVAVTTTRARLSEAQLGAWRVFLRAHSQITRRLEHELLTEHDLPLASYEVLLHLAEAPGGMLRMTDLADRVLLSRSGLTRLVDRLEREGLVARASCPSDARGTNALLTEAGRDRLRSAAPTHLRGVAEHVTDRLTPAEVEQLHALMSKLRLDQVSPPEGGCGRAEGL